jgi:hypothetical protein
MAHYENTYLLVAQQDEMLHIHIMLWVEAWLVNGKLLGF